MTRRMLVLDVDGTIVSRTTPLVSKVLNDSLTQAALMGWPILMATSRSPGTMLQLEVPAAWHAWAVVCNGAAELDPETGSLSNLRMMSRDSCERTITALDSLGLVYDFEAAIADTPTPTHSNQVRKLRELPNSDWWALKFTVRAEGLSAQALIHNLSGRLSDLPFMTSMDSCSVEFSATGTGKQAAVERVAKRHGISASECIAFGNSMNDAELLAWAGTSIVVQPAPAYLMDIADAVVGSPDGNGVGIYLAALLASAGDTV